MPPNTNLGPSFSGHGFRLGGRKSALPTCRDEVLAAMGSLGARTGTEVFTACEVFAEMASAGTEYAEATVFKTMQSTREAPARPPYTRLERIAKEGFRLASAGA